ncbi:Cupredoxin [Pseudovirgaria hyperparasitica]|uniref:Cupredoxin n=1 Tax=Pseudovirgaria hyperparasitica TaxID=470096 RepID=A0A6A6VZR2_9PEZI|nr:Cupredoxin [Pseudovirgaria hyperparasitica]KAF2756142.1 Cupredoxin [Pseudovirgaria hyperparasitica]
MVASSKPWVTLMASLLTLSTTVVAKDWEGPAYPTQSFFSQPLPIPGVKAPKYTFTNPQTGGPIDYYELEIKPFQRKQYPNLAKSARMVGYDGQFPGPTIDIEQGRESVVRYINNGDRPASTHLHGSYSRAPFDGYADDHIDVGQYKDYYYPNQQNARTLWYHDHVVDHTAENVYFGMAGLYLLHDQHERDLALPTGKYDIPLLIMARQYNSDGTLWDPEKNDEDTSIYGDVVEVNGQPWPNLKVEPRKYRFRLLDGGISRTFKLFLNADQKNNQRVPFYVIGSDCGLLAQSVVTDLVTISIAERWDVVIDFSQFAGQNVTLRNDHEEVNPDTEYLGTDRVMRFIVGTTVSDSSNNGAVPVQLRDVPFPPQDQSVNTRHFEFGRGGSNWVINGIGWHDTADRLLAAPQRGSIEIWELENGGGGWSHPIHVHLVDFQVISRTGSDRSVLPYESAAQQDVVWLGPGETVRVIARFSPWPGLYMFHCHNLIHEDHEMLAEFNVTQVADLDLNEQNLFIDPLAPEYAPVGFAQGDLAAGTNAFARDAVAEKVAWFASLNAYADAAVVEEKLVEYWEGKAAAEKRDGGFGFLLRSYCRL